MLKVCAGILKLAVAAWEFGVVGHIGVAQQAFLTDGPLVEHHALRGIGSGQLDGIACLGRGDLCAVGIGGGAIGQAHPVVAFLDLCGQGNAPLVVAVQGQVKCSGIAHLLLHSSGRQ